MRLHNYVYMIRHYHPGEQTVTATNFLAMNQRFDNHRCNFPIRQPFRAVRRAVESPVELSKSSAFVRVSGQ